MPEKAFLKMFPSLRSSRNLLYTSMQEPTVAEEPTTPEPTVVEEPTVEETTIEEAETTDEEETTKSWMRRCEEEYYATVWALEKCNEYGLIIPDAEIERYQKYINMEHDRGIRRGGNLPKIENLQLR